MANSCSPGKTQLICHFPYNSLTLDPRRGWMPLPVVPQLDFCQDTCNSFIALFDLQVCLPVDARKYLELVTNLVLLIFDPPLCSTESWHIVLIQKMFVQMNKSICYLAGHGIVQHCSSEAADIIRSIRSSPGLIWGSPEPTTTQYKYVACIATPPRVHVLSCTCDHQELLCSVR